MKLPRIPSNSAKCLGTIEIRSRRKPLNARGIRQALDNPVWPGRNKPSLFDIIGAGETICFVISDHTRQTATNLVLPVVLDGLLKNGCSLKDMFILVASGIHRHPSRSELVRILGSEMVRRFSNRIFMHDTDDDAQLVTVGTTARGHKVRVNRRAMEADRLILIGTATYHYHAGFGGGRKSLVPGLASRDTIAYNHSLTLDPARDRIHPRVRIGVLDGNPVASEMLEAARMCRPDIIINTVLDPAGRLVGVFSGDLDAAHRAACRLVEKTDRVDIRRVADFVIASAEGARDWVQSHKALFNAHRAIRKGGKVILLAPCPEGLGNERFRYWIRKAGKPGIFRELRKSPEVLGQTALSTRTRGKDTILVTKIPQRDITDLGIETAPDLNSAVRKTLENLKASRTRRPTYYLMPHARHTVPFILSCSN